mmetsp:Transcript_65215/g.181278  ORF Transcript_65215/g.181278 Transcript_65215/m.181278 type:complete len:625 (+) Transcript_65215:1475-3349(+)
MHWNITLPWALNELLHSRHELGVQLVIVRDPILEGVIVDRGDVPSCNGKASLWGFQRRQWPRRLLGNVRTFFQYDRDDTMVAGEVQRWEALALVVYALTGVILVATPHLPNVPLEQDVVLRVEVSFRQFVRGLYCLVELWLQEGARVAASEEIGHILTLRKTGAEVHVATMIQKVVNALHASLRPVVCVRVQAEHELTANWLLRQKARNGAHDRFGREAVGVPMERRDEEPIAYGILRSDHHQISLVDRRARPKRRQGRTGDFHVAVRGKLRLRQKHHRVLVAFRIAVLRGNDMVLLTELRFKYLFEVRCGLLQADYVDVRASAFQYPQRVYAFFAKDGVDNRGLDLLPAAIGRQRHHNMHQHGVEERLAQALQRQRNQFLLLGQCGVLGSADLRQHIARSLRFNTPLDQHLQAALEHECKPLRPPLVHSLQGPNEVVDNCGSAHALAIGKSDRVRHAVRHGSQSLRSNSFVFQKARHNLAVAVIVPPISRDDVYTCPALGLHALSQIRELVVAKKNMHGDVTFSWVLDELLHPRHELGVQLVIVRDPILEGVIVDRGDVPCRDGEASPRSLQRRRRLKLRRLNKIPKEALPTSAAAALRLPHAANLRRWSPENVVGLYPSERR